MSTSISLEDIINMPIGTDVPLIQNTSPTPAILTAPPLSTSQFRECGDCHACCDGHLAGEVRGHAMHPDKPCHFHDGEKCTIYPERPPMCVNYQCGWSQGLFSEEYRPDKVGFIISVEHDPVLNNQFLRLVRTRPDPDIMAMREVRDFALRHGTYVADGAGPKASMAPTEPSNPATPTTMPDPIDLVTRELIRLNEKSVADKLIQTFGEHSTTPDQTDYLARLAFEAKSYRLASKLCTKTLTILERANAPIEQIYSARSNLINVLNHIPSPIVALEHIQIQETIVPHDRDRDLKKAYALYLTSQRDRAETILRRYLDDGTTPPKVLKEIQFNLATYVLYRDFKAGMRQFLTYGPAFNTWNRAPKPYPQWNGQIYPDMHLLVYAEAGIGDEFINIRFCKMLKARGIKYTYIAFRPDIAKIFADSGYHVAMSEDGIDSATHYCYSMTLPMLLDVGENQLWDGPYIRANGDLVQRHYGTTHPTPDMLVTSYHHSALYPANMRSPDPIPDSVLRIAIRWQGAPHYEQDVHRSLDYQRLVNAVKDGMPNDRPYLLSSIQRDDGVEVVDAQVRDLSPYMETYEDTLAILAHQDIVITSCTSIAHASAAMGCRTIVLVPTSAYYVWCQDSERTPWYGDHVTVIHQEIAGVWSDVYERLSEVLSLEFSS